MFHIGKIKRVVGNAFACSKEEFWQEKYVTSPSRLSTNNASMFYPFLINREGTQIKITASKKIFQLKFLAQRDVNDVSNKIVFSVPIHVMNIDSLPSNVKREIAFSLTVGDTKLWTGMHDVTILPAEAPNVLQTVNIDTVINYPLIASPDSAFHSLFCRQPLIIT